MRHATTTLRSIACLLALALASPLAGCHAPPPPLHQGCFNPAPRKSTIILEKRGAQLRWPSAHRGDRQAGPDNSLAAILAAARRGVPLIEVDVRTSADGKLFLFHDRRLWEKNYVGPASLRGREVQSLTAAELRALRLPGRTPERVVFLDEAIEAVRSYPSALQLDLKGESPAMASLVVEIAQASRALDSIVVQCQSVETGRFLRTFYPGVAILIRADEKDEVSKALELRPVPEIIQIDADWMSKELVEEIQRAGSHVLVKTLDQGSDHTAQWRMLIDNGVDIVLTDFPRAFTRSIPRPCEAR